MRMDSKEDIKRGAVRLVTAPSRVLSRHEKPPRPYEIGWVKEQIERERTTSEPYSSFSWRTT